MPEGERRLHPSQALAKRAFDVAASLTGLIGLWWLILLAWCAASIDTRANGFFVQRRVGRGGRHFHVVKLRTMRVQAEEGSTVTTRNDSRITRFGALLRRWKIDELPQLFNVLVGDMSFVGPRPDVPGFADTLVGEAREILSVRPGITGPATLKYRDEEILLAAQPDPERYNREVIFPDKVAINRDYIRNYSFWRDLYYIKATILGRS